MDHNQGVSVDTGKIKDTSPADGWAAIFVLTEPPYAQIMNIIKWVTVVRNSQDYLEAMVAGEGEPSGVFVSFVGEPLHFYRYIYLPAYIQPDGNRDWLNQAFQQAQQIGYQMSQEQNGYDPTAEEPDGVSETEEDEPEPEIFRPDHEEPKSADEIAALIDAEIEEASRNGSND